MDRITLRWQGGFSLSDLDNHAEGDIRQAGVYLWCLGQDNGPYGIVYVGKAASILQRLQAEKSEIKNGSASLFGIGTGSPFEVVYCPGYHGQCTEEVIQANLTGIRILYAIPGGSWHSRVKDIEGAIQIHLWRKPETRQFLITGVSSWNLRDVTIENTFSESFHLHGITDGMSIETPRTRQARAVSRQRTP
jgi:hypothetical protein